MWNQDENHIDVMRECSETPVLPRSREEHPARLNELQPRRIHAVKQCQHCLTFWGRDVNAARNIFRIFVELVRDRQKHLFFRRPPPNINARPPQEPNIA